MKQKHEPLRWLLLIHQLPAEPAYLRVKVGRRLARVGAVALKNSVYLLPARDSCREDFSWIRREILDEKGDASLFEASALEGLSNEDIERLFRAARAKEYEQIGHELAALKTGVRLDKPHERQALLAVLARLDEQLGALERIDFFATGAAGALRDQLVATRLSVEQRAGTRAVSPSSRLRVADYQGRTWVTRSGVKVDRVACAWLVRRFIDKSPKFKFVEASGYTRRAQELCFDMPEGEFTHEGELCSIEVLCRRFALSERGLARIAEIVHDLDVKDGRYKHPETEGVRALIEGIVAQHARDEARIEAASPLFDALLHASVSATPGKAGAAGRGKK